MNAPIHRTPLQKEIVLDRSKTSMSKTNPKGIIEYANQDFMDICGFTESELMGQPHNIVRHPDMPKLIFKIMWDRLHQGKDIYALVKNLAKDGRYYWVIAHLETKMDENGAIISHFSRRKAAPVDAVKRMEKYYQLFKSIETRQSVEVAERYFYGLLEDKNINYDDFFFDILKIDKVAIEKYFNITNVKPAIEKNPSDTSPSSKRPTPVDREIKLDPSKTILSKTDSKGIIEFANDYFMEICGYEKHELMGKPHNIIRHPDMPKVIFKLLWDRLKKGENVHALVKNLAKDGRYYWVLTNFETKYNEDGSILSQYARRKAAPGNAVFKIQKLYKTLLSIEKNQNQKTAEKYFFGLLEEKRQGYDEFILELLNISKGALKIYFQDAASEPKVEEKKRGVFSRLFK